MKESEANELERLKKENDDLHARLKRAHKNHDDLLGGHVLALRALPEGAVSDRQRIIQQLIGLLHSGGVNSPGIGPSSTYEGPDIGFSPGRMLAYCQTCRVWFRCPGLADQPASLSINEMASAILAAGGHPR
jgi:hypothetical protein